MSVTYALECWEDGHDHAEHLATILAEALPRVGDSFRVLSKRLTGASNDPAPFRVAEVYWEADLDKDKPKAYPSVIIEPENAPVLVLYCVCADKDKLKDDEDPARCGNCGDKFP